MHVVIERKAGKVGWFFGLNYFMIDLQVTFTETELALLKTNNLYGYVLFTREEYAPPYPGTSSQWPLNKNYRVHQLIHSNGEPITVFYGTTVLRADRAEKEIREGLEGLKRMITNADKQRARDSYEL